MSSATQDCAPLLDGASRGDQGAVGELLVRLRPSVRRYCRARLGRTDDSYQAADEAAEKVGRAVLAHLQGGEGLGTPFAALVYDTAQRVVQDALTGRPQPAPAAVGTSVTESAAVAGARLNRLPATYSEVLILRAVVGLPVVDCAAALGLTEQAVRIAQHRGLVRLRVLAGE